MPSKQNKPEQPELAETTSAAIATRADTSTPYSIIMAAVADERCDPAKLRELLAVRREWLADDAAQAFNAAVVRFQQTCRVIAKADTANGRAYARMDRIWREVRPIMEECGLAVTWESVTIEGDVCKLEGHLRHASGHAQRLAHAIPLPDKISGQNAAQRAGSGETYAKRYATCAALGIQTGVDDDGCGGTPAERITVEQEATLRELCEASGRKVESLLVLAGVKTLAEYPATRFDEVCAMLRAAIREKGGRA